MIFGFPLSRPSPIEILPSSTLMLEPQIDRTPFEAYCCFCGATQALNKQPKHQPGTDHRSQLWRLHLRL